MPAGSTYTPIATTTLGSAAASVSFTSLGSYTDIILVVSGNTSNNVTDLQIQFNSDTGANYSYTALGYNTTTGSSSSRESSVTYMRFTTNSSFNTSGQSNVILNFQNLMNTTTYKTVIGRGNNGAYGVNAAVGLWRSTSAVTSIQVNTHNLATRTFSIGSTFTLYGIAAA